MGKSRKPVEEPAYPCAVAGCRAPAHHRAPRSRQAIGDYQWLCLEHVRVFNQAWDYFQDMTPEEIEAFQHDALTGHRPTWNRDTHFSRHPGGHVGALEEGLARFFGHAPKERTKPPLPAKERKALATLELDDRVGLATLKKHYRALVKQHHPDLHRGNALKEEHFKRINAAYAYLLKVYEKM